MRAALVNAESLGSKACAWWMPPLCLQSSTAIPATVVMIAEKAADMIMGQEPEATRGFQRARKKWLRPSVLKRYDGFFTALTSSRHRLLDHEKILDEIDLGDCRGIYI